MVILTQKDFVYIWSSCYRALVGTCNLRVHVWRGCSKYFLTHVCACQLSPFSIPNFKRDVVQCPPPPLAC